ncbi:Rne/Rng family ribonuclease [Rickettsiales endosymbiont of Trichoplax sp. H2]|uniref:Rne/Rng family ribonuclease n=1 Tax=Rickettsiales endosymbiont of Trichoplax sp. H2 TaxID=2021221 RepID=UPI0012B24DB9|nr:Rne/Rng family ribonuclease [Rickettsiales endosymbiont of Trichoplax sp. H2]MSO13684.1 Ribonuclease E [Rickettsiales endosymbiont of Trichoplax sp. H2]
MLKKILIDAFYPEETKFILIAADGKLEEFYYQNFNTKLIKGNIYLGKVSRIEPSLQAAFIDYGNDKKGFLSFEMIHPKYYQIPVGDKEQLLNKIKENKSNYNEDDSSNASEYPDKFVSELYDNYKIQEVIKKDQIILVQVEKEERGNKGAFLTTYISLSGRYCVFSPNSFKNNIGISRKLDDEEERERLKKISSELLENYSESSLILRTASAHRTKVEIKRDFEYLINIWEKIKNSAVSSFAPSLVYEEGDILINNIKEHYTSEVEKIIVSGNKAYKKVSDFLKIFIPKNIQKLEEYSNKVPILHKYKVEEQLSNLYSNVVKLKSGGYLVINTTEAMISIDVNSGTYTEEYSIENTALNINLEAAVEIAKQVRFRGLSGLIVVDFIDMLELQNKKLVEREFKKAFWNDKVKVQIGRISEFGLLEMSRQRVGKSFIEANSKICPTCLGKGRITLNSSIATLLIGKLTFLLSRKKAKVVSIIAASDIITYLMNNFKNELSFLENSYNIQIHLSIDDIISPENYKIIFHQTSNIATVKNRRYNRPESFLLNDLDNIGNKEIFNNFEENIVEHDGNINDIKMQSKRPLKTNFRKRKKNRNNGMKNTNKQNNDNSSIFKKIWTKVTS